MNIVITVEHFDPNKGYLEYYLATELAELGHKVSIFTFRQNHETIQRKFKDGFHVIRLSHIAELNSIHIPSLKELIFIIKFIKKEKPDIIHCQPLFSPLSLYFIFWKYIYNYRITGSLITGVSSNWSIIKSVLFSLTKLSIKLVKKKIDVFFVKNKGYGSIVSKSYGILLKDLVIIPLGAKKTLFQFDSKSRKLLRKYLNLSNDDVVVVYSGKLIPSKEIDILIKAIKPIIKQNQKVKLMIIGKGEECYEEYLHNLVSQLKISNNVIFHPLVHRTDLPNFYSAGDIAVWPGTPSISIIEAASNSLPLIIQKNPVSIYKVEYGNGFVYKKGDVDELSGYLEILINDAKLRQEMGKRSRLLVEKKLNWDNIAQLYLNAYKGALDSVPEVDALIGK